MPDLLEEAKRLSEADELAAAEWVFVWKKLIPELVERVEQLREALTYCGDFLEDVELPLVGYHPHEPKTIELTRTRAGWLKAQRLYREALAQQRKDGDG